jgi:hypothetical protein
MHKICFENFVNYNEKKTIKKLNISDYEVK